jgi:hypothetical protein
VLVVVAVAATDLRMIMVVATDLSCISSGGGHGSERRGVVVKC